MAQLVKNPSANAGDAGDAGLIPRLGRSLEGENRYPIQYSCLENSMDRGAWRATAHGVTKSQTWLSAHTYTCRKSMTVYSSPHITLTVLPLTLEYTQGCQGPAVLQLILTSAVLGKCLGISKWGCDEGFFVINDYWVDGRKSSWG